MAGVREVILPADNEPNVREDLSPELLEGLELRYAKSIQEVVDLALEKDPVPVGATGPGSGVRLGVLAAGPPN